MIGSRSPEVRRLWSEQAASHWGKPSVVVYAGRCLLVHDLFEAERHFLRARELEPDNPEWIYELATLYSHAISVSGGIRTNSGRFMSPIGTAMWTRFGDHLTERLQRSNAPSLIGATAEGLFPSELELLSNLRLAKLLTMKETSARYDFAEQLLTRAQSLEPDNERWAESLRRLGEFRSGAAAERGPAAEPPAAVVLRAESVSGVVLSQEPVRRIRVGAEVQRNRLNHYVRPVCPAAALEGKIQGTVRFNARITIDGHIAELSLISGHPLLIESARDAVKQWTYRPTTLSGQPVEVQTIIEVSFAIEDRGATKNPKGSTPNSI